MTESQRVALVYPPFAPPWIPSLGLAVLSAGIKKLGIECRTFHWNLQLVKEMPGKGREKLAQLSQYTKWFPWNEWIFTDVVFPGFDTEQRLADLDQQILGRRSATELATQRKRRALLEPLRARAPALVDEMVDQLEPYGIVGISSVFWQGVPALALARRLKERWPDKTVVLGGANCDGEMGREQMVQFPFLDFAFSGEVDFAFPEFVRRRFAGEPVDDVPGILYRDAEGQVQAGPPAAPLQDMDSLPDPDFDDYFAEVGASKWFRWRPRMLVLESSRGCWWGAKHHCTFCGLNADGMGYRQKTPERFQQEVVELSRRHSAKTIIMADNILSMDYFKGFLGWLQQRKLGVSWYYETKSNLTRAQVEDLAAAGIRWIQPGIESFSSKTLTLMDKGARGIQQVALVKYARESGVRLNYAILGGFPGEDPEEYDRMARAAPALTHFQPPSGINEIMYERFSPYHNDPGRFGVDLQPSLNYSILYPFDEDVLSRMVYHFERRDLPTFPYLEGIREQHARWREAYQGGSALTWKQEGPDIVIDEGRPGFPAGRYRLQDYAATIFPHLDQPTSVAALRRKLSGGNGATNGNGNWLAGHFRAWRRRAQDTRISFSSKEFEQQPERCLEPLVHAGLVYQEGSSYLTLPVAQKCSPPPGRKK